MNKTSVFVCNLKFKTLMDTFNLQESDCTEVHGYTVDFYFLDAEK